MRSVLLLSYLACLFFLPFRIRRRESAGIRQAEEFLSLLTRIRREIACFSRPLPDVVRSADLPALRAAGFYVAPGETDLLAAFSRAEPSLLLPAEAIELLASFFSGAGAPMKSEAIGACDHAIGRLDEMIAREKSEGIKRVRLRATLILTGGLLFLLLVI